VKGENQEHLIGQGSSTDRFLCGSCCGLGGCLGPLKKPGFVSWGDLIKGSKRLITRGNWSLGDKNGRDHLAHELEAEERSFKKARYWVGSSA